MSLDERIIDAFQRGRPKQKSCRCEPVMQTAKQVLMVDNSIEAYSGNDLQFESRLLTEAMKRSSIKSFT